MTESSKEIHEDRRSRSALLSMAGAFKDDDTLPELRKAIAAARGRQKTGSEPND